MCVPGIGVGVGVYVSVYSHGPWLYSSTVDGMIYELEYTERKTHTHTHTRAAADDISWPAYR